MATWEDLTRSKKMQLATQLAGSNKTAENINRAMEILSNNPDILRRVAEEIGIEDEIDAAPRTSSIEENVDRLINKKIPEPKKDESIRDYVARLQNEIDKVDRGQEDNESYEDDIFGQSKDRESEL